MLRTMIKQDVETALAAEATAESLSEIAVAIDDTITKATALSLGQQDGPVTDTIRSLMNDLRHYAFLIECAFSELDSIY